MHLLCGRFKLTLDRPLIMGVLNVTPDSFSDGGRYVDVPAAVAHARALIEQGADMIDIGGESTRPGAAPVTVDEERQRVMPVLEGLRDCGVPVSIDTRRPEVMREAIACGASLVNDISALEAAGAVDAVVASDVAVCLMHKQGEPGNMQTDPRYRDVVGEVRDYLLARVEHVKRAGVDAKRILIDPGFGFGKTYEHNIALLRGLREFTSHGVPVLVGMSRKAMIGRMTGRDVRDRMTGSVAAAMLAVEEGAAIVRVHDVAATRDALKVWHAVRRG